MTTTAPDRVGALTWCGLAVVLVSAAVLSFDTLRQLAAAVAIHPALAPLLPVSVDAGAAVSCGVWLSRRAPADAARFARTMTWSLLALTVVANAAQLGMLANHVTPPWWVAVAVGAIPPTVVGGTVHLAVLVGRTAQPGIEAAAAPVEPPALNPQSRPGRVDTPPPAPDVPTGTPTPAPAKPKPQRTAAEKQAAAERSARSRRHKAGDHTLCLPDRCPDAPRVRAA